MKQRLRWLIAAQAQLLVDWLRRDQEAEWANAGNGVLVCVIEGFGPTGDWHERGDTAHLEEDATPEALRQ